MHHHEPSCGKKNHSLGARGRDARGAVETLAYGLQILKLVSVNINTYFSKHFIPYDDFHKLSKKDKKKFRYCHHNTHGLSYLPQPTTEQTFLTCHEAPRYHQKVVGNIRKFISKEGV